MGIITSLLALPQAVFAGDSTAVDGAEVYFINLQDGDVLSSPVVVQFGLKNMGISPAGIQGIEHTGHHHLLINTELGYWVTGSTRPTACLSCRTKSRLRSSSRLYGRLKTDE